MVDDIPKIKSTKEAGEPSDAAKSAVAKAEAKLAQSQPESQEFPPKGQPSSPSSDPVTPSSPTPSSSGLKPTPLKKKLPKWAKIVLIILGFWVVIGVLIAIPAFRTLQAARTTIALARESYTAGKNQNLPEFNAKLETTKNQLQNTHRTFKILAWTKFIPFLGGYYNDGNHTFNATIAGIEAAQILGTTIEPYAEVLGFEGQGTFIGGTAEDRITKLVETLDKVVPEIDQVAAKVEIANSEIQQVNPNRYPFSYKGTSVKEAITNAQTFASSTLIAVTDAKPLIELLPQMLGVEKERKYAVIFQNDAEIRATGGFMTAYGILRVDSGKVFQEKSDDIYALDAKFNKRLKPPDLIDRYLPLVFYWNLRDMNLSPDFKESMDTFYSYYKDIPGEPEVDGIIAVDTQVLKDIVEVLGPIDVPGFGTFSAEIDSRCDCPQIIYELEDLATRPVAFVRTERKGFLAPMLQTILLKIYGAPKNMWSPLFTTITRNIGEKHVLFYMLDAKEQSAIESINIAGRIKDSDADYFHINDLNFAGAKSNLFVTEEVEQVITIAEDGTVTKKVTVTYKNPAPASNCDLEAGKLCLNGILRDVVRLYVPRGSELKEALGFEEDTTETLEDLGKTVFQGFFTLNPQSQAKIIFEYTLPEKHTGNEYLMLIQKQPGKKKPKYTITINQEFQEEFELAADKELIIKL